MAKGQSWPSDIPQASDLFTLSAGFGLLAGLVEGASLLLLQRSQWAGENVDTLLVPAGILYVSPLTDMVLAVALAFLAAGICRLSRGLVSG